MKKIIFMLFLVGCIQNANAVLVSTSQSLDFSSGKQSLFGSGAAASFTASGSVGTSNLGFSYALNASSGTVENANFNGSLSFSYDNYVAVGATDNISLQFSGDASGGMFNTLYGLSVATNWKLLGLTGCIYCAGQSLNVNPTFTPALNTSFSGSDTVTPYSPNVGPDLIVASGTAGIDIDLTQDSTLTAIGISGTVIANNITTGTTKSIGVNILTNGQINMDLGLDEVGLWDISFTNLTLNNDFFSTFSAQLVPFVQYTIGLGCGDAGTDADNGVLCGGDDRADWTLADIGLGTTETFSLNFNTLNLPTFRIETYATGGGGNGGGGNGGGGVTPVPEPGTLALIGLGLLGLALNQRKKVHTH